MKGKRVSLDTFHSSPDSLSKSNRRIELRDTLPWSEIECLYNNRLNNGKHGAGNEYNHMLIGFMLIKRKMNLSYEKIVRKNLYIRRFVNLLEFTDKPAFGSSVFITSHKRVFYITLARLTSVFEDMGDTGRCSCGEKTDSNAGSNTDSFPGTEDWVNYSRNPNYL